MGTSKSSVPFKFIDFFSGIGGMRLAFEELGGICVASCENDSFARLTYSENFNVSNHPFFENIEDVVEDDIPVYDIFLAGFPCQPFSNAGIPGKVLLGKKHGFDDEEQGNLFFEISRILELTRPKAFLLENVKNLKSHDNGRTFLTIMEILEGRKNLGYHCKHMVIDAIPWVPQHRERTFIVGFRDTDAFEFDEMSKPPIIEWPVLSKILHPEDGSEKPEKPYTNGKMGELDSRYTLTDHQWEYHQDHRAKHRALGNGYGYGLVNAHMKSRTLTARYYKDGSEIFIDQGNKKNPRRLTPRECSRLMGFDRENENFKVPVSDTQAYKQFGNAIVVDVVKEIGKCMLNHLNKNVILGPRQAEIKFNRNGSVDGPK